MPASDVFARAAPAAAPPLPKSADDPAPGQRLPGGLVYVGSGMPGLQRVRRGKGFGYPQRDGRWLPDADKFERMAAFGKALPRIRARLARDLAPRRGQTTLVRTQVLTAIVRLLDTTYLRVGNEEYALSNQSYGLTTLRTPHAAVRGSTLQLRFRGKSGVQQSAALDDPRVARVVRRCQQSPGQELSQ